MRKINAIISAGVLVLFIVHAVLGSFQLLGSGNVISKVISYLLLALVAAHVVIGIKLTVDTLAVAHRTKAPYFKENKLFWLRRISGYVIMVLIVFHVTAFSYYSGDALRLHEFTSLRLATQLLLVASIAVHVISNVKPMLIAFGIKKLKPRAVDILLVLTVLILFMAIAFIIYYLRWNG